MITKKLVFILAAIILSVGGYAYFLTATKQKAIEPVKIGIIYKGASFQEIVDGFIEGLSGQVDSQKYPYTIIKRDVLGDEQADFDKAVAEVIAGGADALFVVAIEPMNAAKNATKENKIPVVFAFGGNPVATGNVASLQNSGNNFTGVTWLSWELSGKRLEILKEMVPSIKRVTAITRTQSKAAEVSFHYIDAVSGKLGIAISKKEVKTVADIERSLAEITSKNADAILYVPDPFIVRNAKLIIAASLEKKLPIVFPEGKFAYDGALASYGPKFFDAGKQASRLMKKIIVDGARPTDIPIEAAANFEFIINLKTARTLGLTINPEILSRADKVIE